ncbi:MAG: iron-containing alcohol dehydrogenase [Chloroflexota bacterium]
MNPFEFATATRIIFGEGKLREIATIAPEFGRRALVVCGSVERAQPLFALLDEAKVAYTPFSVRGEPNLELIKAGVEQAHESEAEMVISIGGGSTIDAGKAIAALATNPGDPLDYLEIIGKGQPISQTPLPFIAIPTTAGTGAEVTRNAVISSPEHRLKVSLRSPLMLAKVALVDPELTYGLPPAITAYTGMDALTQVIEPLVSNAANVMTDMICQLGILYGMNAIHNAYAHDDPSARNTMALVSLWGGMALANARLGAVHGFAGVLGGMFDAPHGALCATLLPAVTYANVRALRTREPENIGLKRYTSAVQYMSGYKVSDPGKAANLLAQLTELMEIPPLRIYGIQQKDFAEIVEKSAKSSSMKGNPIVLTTEELTKILEKAL